MKEYSDVLLLAANTAFNSYYSGDDNIWQQIDFALIGFIFDRPSEKVEMDVKIVFNVVHDAFYSKFKTEAA